MVNVVKYTSPMNGMGMISFGVIPRQRKPKLRAGRSVKQNRGWGADDFEMVGVAYLSNENILVGWVI